jgi:CheY-like chemotaxis protein
MGIGAEMLERIFEPFVRDQEPIHPNRQASAGLGLGLALVRSIVRGHGGEVRAHSRGLGQGSCFVVSLPTADGQAKGSAEAVFPTDLAPTERTVVLVEDQEDSREVLCEYLTQEGWQVQTAATGKAAIELIVRERPQTAVVDIGLPDISGIEVATQVRAALGERTPYLIALTGYGQHRDNEAVLQAGFHHHLVKPASIPRLLELMRLRPRNTAEVPHRPSEGTHVHIVSAEPALAQVVADDPARSESTAT